MLVKMIKAFFTFFGLVFSTFPSEGLWVAEQVDPRSSEWVIHPTETNPQTLPQILRKTYQNEKKSRIRHIALGSLYQRADIQADVVENLERQERFKVAPPPFGKNNWDFPEKVEVQKLVADALLHSHFVKSLNDDLSAFRLRIVSVAMEKLYFTKDHNKVTWNAIVWLKVSEIKA